MTYEDWERRVAAINRFMERRGLKPSPWAEKAGVANGALRNFRKGISKSLSQETLEKLATAAGTTVAVLLGEQEDSDAPLLPPQRPIVSPAVQVNRFDFMGEEYAAIGVFDIRASAGPGAVNEESPEPLHHNFFRLQWLRQVSSADPSNLAVIKVSGDSMWDTLHDGDHVLVDRTQTNLRREGLYIILIDDELMIKRVSMHPTTKLVSIRSDNPVYPSFNDIDPRMLCVVGRVVWLGRSLGR
ncbi:hypothetical protein CCP2SC5_2230003 [Azospirillaceae bacterium]